MKSYKINQAVEKTIFPIREDLSEIRQEVSEGWLRTKSYVDQIMQIFLPAIVSCILTAAISNPVLTSINRCNSNWINLLTINVCIDNMDEIALKTNDDRANELRGRFIDLRDTLTRESVSGN